MVQTIGILISLPHPTPLRTFYTCSRVEALQMKFLRSKVLAGVRLRELLGSQPKFKSHSREHFSVDTGSARLSWKISEMYTCSVHTQGSFSFLLKTIKLCRHYVFSVCTWDALTKESTRIVDGLPPFIKDTWTYIFYWESPGNGR